MDSSSLFAPMPSVQGTGAPSLQGSGPQLQGSGMPAPSSFVGPTVPAGTTVNTSPSAARKAVAAAPVQAAPQTYSFGSPAPAPAPAPAPVDPNQQIAQQAGTAGVSTTELGSALGLSDAEKQAIYNNLGVSKAEQQAYNPPSENTQQVYTDAFNQAGLPQYQQTLTDLQNKINDKNNALATALGSVNDNPWLSEASRVGRAKNVQELAQADIKNLTDQYNQTLNAYNKGLTEVNGIVTRTTQDYQNNQKLAQDHLTYLEKQAAGQISDAANSKLQRYLPDYLTSKANASKPDTVTAGDGSTWQWDKTQGKFVALTGPKSLVVGKSSLVYNPATGKMETRTGGTSTGGIGGSSTGSTGGFSTDSTNFWAQAASSGVNMNSLIPSLGMGAAAVALKESILNRIASNAQTLGIDGGTFGAMLSDSKAKQKAMSALQQQGSQTLVNEQSASKYFDTLATLADKVDAATGVPMLDSWIRTGEVQLTGDANTNNFISQLTESLTEYAKVMSGQTTGAGVHQAAAATAQGLLDKGLSAGAIKSFIDLAKQNMSNRTSSYDAALKGLFGDIKNLQTPDNSGGLGGTTTPAAAGKDSLGIL